MASEAPKVETSARQEALEGRMIDSADEAAAERTPQKNERVHDVDDNVEPSDSAQAATPPKSIGESVEGSAAGEDNSQFSPSPLSKLDAEQRTPANATTVSDDTETDKEDPNNVSYWAMMERYVGDQERDPDATDADVSMSTEALLALVDNVVGNQEGDGQPNAAAAPPKTPMRTLKHHCRQWTKEDLSVAPSNNSKGARQVAVLNANVSGLSTDAASTPAGRHSHPVSKASASSLYQKTGDLAMDETKVYLRRIQELQEQLQASQAQAEEEAIRLEVAECKCQQLEKQLQRARTLSPLNTTCTPASNNNAAPHTPVSDSLLERNKTLVKEVRFADQTCVELSGQKRALEKEVESLEGQIQAMQEDRVTLHQQMSEHDKLYTSTKAQCEAAEKRVVQLESELAQTQKSVEFMETRLEDHVKANAVLDEKRQVAEKRAVEAESHLSVARKSLAQSEKGILELQSELTTSRRALAQSEQLHLALASEIETQRTSPRAASDITLQQENDQLSKQVSDMKQELEQEKLRTKEVVEEKDHETRAAHAMSRSMERAKEEAETKLTVVLGQLQTLQKAESASSLASRRKCQDAEKDNATLRAKVKSLQHELDEALQLQKDRVAELNLKCQQLAQEQLKAEQAQNQLLQAQSDLEKSREGRDDAERDRRNALAERDQLACQIQELQQSHASHGAQLVLDLRQTTRELVDANKVVDKIRDELAKEKASGQAAQMVANQKDAELTKTRRMADEEHNALLRTKDEASRLEAKFVEEIKELKEDLRQYEATVKAARLDREKHESACSELEARVATLTQEKQRLQKSLESTNVALAAATESNAKTLEKPKLWLPAGTSQVQLQRSALPIGSADIATADARALIQNGTSGPVDPSEVDKAVARSSLTLGSETTEQNSSGNLSTQSGLLGTSLLLGEEDATQPTESPAAHLHGDAFVNQTMHLECMEEARVAKDASPASPTVSTIAGMSHLLNGTFLTDGDISPSKAPPFSQSPIETRATAVIQRLEMERDEARQKLRLVQRDHEELKEKLVRRKRSDELERGDELLKPLNSPTLMKEIAELQGQLDSVHATCRNVTNERDLLLSEKSALKSQILDIEEALKHEKHVCETASSRAGTELRALKEETSALLKEQARLTMICSAVSQVLDAESNERDSLPTMVEEMRAELHALRSSRSSEINNLLRERDLLQKRAAHQTSEMIEKKIENEMLLEKVDAHERRIAELTQECKCLHQDLTQHQEDFKEALSAGKAEAEKMRSKLAAVEAGRNQLRAELSEHIDAHNLTTGKFDDLSRELETLRASNAETTEACAHLEHTVAVKEDELQRAQQELQLKSDEVDRFEKEAARLAGSLQKMSHEIEASAVRVANAEAQVMEAHTDLANEQLDRQAVEAENILLSEKIAKMDQDLQTAHGKEQERDEKLTQEIAAKQQVEANMQKLEQRFKELAEFSSSRATDAENKIRHLESTLSLVTDQKHGLERSLHEQGTEKHRLDTLIADQSRKLVKTENKCLRLKEYARKLAAKCDDWQLFYEKQSGVFAGLRSENALLTKEASELALRYREQDEIHRLRQAQWTAERSELCKAQTQLEEELECLAEELPPIS